MYGNLLLTIGGTIQQIIENLQLAADERLIEPLWRMQVLVDRASRARTDEEMDRYDDQLLRALSSLRSMSDQLAHVSSPPPPPLSPLSSHPSSSASLSSASASTPAAGREVGESGGSGGGTGDGLEIEAAALDERDAAGGIPLARYNGRRVTARLEATR
jgi:hypothetical protein